MRRLLAALALVLVTSPAASATAASMPARPGGQAPPTGTGPVSVQVDRTAIHTTLGGRFAFSSTVRNRMNRPEPGLIAHLNIFSIDPSTYVDPEDWSSHRTQFLDVLPEHGSATLSWPVQAVNSGPLVLYVAVTDVGRHTVTVSAPILLSVERQPTLDAAGILPLAVGVPGAVGALLLVTLRRRRRLR